MRKLTYLLITLALALLLSLAACGAPGVGDFTDHPIDQPQTEEKKNQEDKTNQLQEKEEAGSSPENVLPDKEQKNDAPIVTPSGAHNSDSDNPDVGSPTTKPSDANTGSNSGSGSNAGSSDSSGSGNTKPSGPDTDNSSNTGSSDNSGSSGSDSNSDSNSSSDSDESSDSDSTSTNESDSMQQPSSGTESDSGSAESTPAHQHEWTDTETVVVCFGCGEIDHEHNWESIYETEIVDDYEMVCITRCVHCGIDISTCADAIDHVYEEMDKGNSGQTRTTYEQVKVGSHEEQVLVGYKCSICGGQRTAEGKYAGSEMSHRHVWENAETVVVCFECGEIDHTHIWEPHYITEIVEDYEMQPKNFCSTCNEDITELLASGASMKQHKKETGCASGGYYGRYVEVKVGSHEEQVLLGYSCSICGAIQ